MSWRGFTKAVSRLPHVVMSKAGAADITTDEDFDLLNRQFEKRRGVVEKIHGDLNKMCEAMKTSEVHLLNLLNMLNEVSSQTCDEKTTVILDRLKAHQSALGKSHDLLMTNAPILLQINKISQNINGKIIKRNHKLVDYDRHRNAVAKYAKNEGTKTRTLSEEKSMAKAESAMEEAEQLYLCYNEMLKRELPIYLDLTNRLLQPVITDMITFHRNISLDEVGIFKDLHIENNIEIIMRNYDKIHDPLVARISDLATSKLGRGHIKTPMKNTSSLETKIPLRQLTPNPKHEKSPSRVKIDIYPPQPGPQPNTKSDEKLQLQKSPGGKVAELASRLQISSISSSSSTFVKPAASPPQLPKRKEYVRALYDFVGSEPGDLSFKTGDLIEIVKRTDHAEEWWTGSIDGQRVGIFPANYTEIIN